MLGNNPMPDTPSLPGPDLSPAPADAPRVINHGGISGGKDSTALLLWMVHESGYPIETLDFTFSDTGNEAPETYEHVQMLSERVHPIQTIQAARNFYELAAHRNRFPTAKARFCTTELKMIPSKAHMDALMAAGYTVINHSGVRASESADRATLEEREPAWLSYFGCEGFRPLLRWTIEDVWAIHARYGIPPNPLYARGCKRVGCLPCVMSRKNEIRLVARTMPERIDMIREQEGLVGISRGDGMSTFFARDKIPIRFRDKVITTTLKTRTRPATPLLTDALPFAPEEFPARVTTTTGNEQMAVATIDAVVRWASAGEGFTETLDYDDLEELPTCDSRSGLCE